MIKKVKNKYRVLSEKTGSPRSSSGEAGRSFGEYRTLSDAKKRLRQIEFFKHLKKKPGR